MKYSVIMLKKEIEFENKQEEQITPPVTAGRLSESDISVGSNESSM